MCMLFQPAQQRFNRRGFRTGLGVHDELRLAAGAFKRHDCESGRIGRDRRSVISANQVQTDVQPRGRASGCEDPAIVDEQYIGVHMHRR